MRITFLTPSDNLTGGTRVVATYATLLQRRGHQVTVVSNAPDRPSLRQRWRRWRSDGWPVNDARGSGHLALAARQGVTHRVLERPRPIRADDLPDADVLMATWWETAAWMQAMPPAKGRQAHLVQGYEVWTGGQVRERVHAALRLPTQKIAISHALARQIRDELPGLPMDVVPNAVDLDRFDAPARPRNQTPTVGFIYARAPIKGADICARACELARRTLPQLRVLAFGVDRPSADWPLPAETVFTQAPDQACIPRIYAQCDAWLFGSRLDSFGLPILEAMACRTPVIGVPIGAAPDLLRRGGGVLLPDASPQAMADAIVRLCTGPDADWAASSHQAWQQARSYSWEDATTALLDRLQAHTVPEAPRQPPCATWQPDPVRRVEKDPS